MVTKVDESVGLGGVLDVVIKNRLSLGYVSQGQKVPEDLIPARVEYMIDKAVELMDQEITATTKNENDSRPNRSAMVRN